MIQGEFIQITVIKIGIFQFFFQNGLLYDINFILLDIFIVISQFRM